MNSTNKICEDCGTIKFKHLNDSILLDSYSFITLQNLIMCNNCGSKYIICQKCSQILTHVYLGMPKLLIKEKCFNCNIIEEKIHSFCEK